MPSRRDMKVERVQLADLNLTHTHHQLKLQNAQVLIKKMTTPDFLESGKSLRSMYADC
jgi:hypothetical protein